MQDERHFRIDQIDPVGPLAKALGVGRQVMSADLISRGDGWERGVRSVLLQNDRLMVDVVIDRGMDIAGARIDGVPIGWLSPTGIVGPWYVENVGRGPHRSFYGGLLKTCGLDHIGAPRTGSDPEATVYPMHGRISSSPAQLRSYGVEEQGGKLVAFVEGIALQAGVLAENLTLKRRVSLTYGSGVIELTDVISNEGANSVPHAVLYHVNVGWPLMSPGACLQLPNTQLRGDTSFAELAAPTGIPTSRAWHFESKSGPYGPGTAGIYNRAIDADRSAGLKLAWDAEQLPTMVHWQLSGRGGQYAMALEPSTLKPHSVSGPMEFPVLEPGESRTLKLKIELQIGRGGANPLAIQ